VTPYLLVAAAVFAVGAAGVALRRDPVVMVMCIELMWNAANLALVAASRFRGGPEGQLFAFVVVVAAAADVAVGLALMVLLGRRPGPLDADDWSGLRG
jgi:NADH-quinone oxidoreductase subunit K